MLPGLERGLIILDQYSLPETDVQTQCCFAEKGVKMKNAKCELPMACAFQRSKAKPAGYKRITEIIAEPVLFKGGVRQARCFAKLRQGCSMEP